MKVQVVFSSNPIRDTRLAREFEQAVSQALTGPDGLREAWPVNVRFHVWEEDAVRYACKVECASAPTMGMERPPWRWWSGLVETPQELGRDLREALRGRRRRDAAARDDRPEPAAEERWGWAGELQLS